MTNLHQLESNKKPSGKFITAPPKPLITPGEYQATIVDWQRQRQYKTFKILFQFELIVDGEIITLTHFTNIKLDDEGRMIEPSSTMKIAKTLSSLFPDLQFEEIDLNMLTGMKCIVGVRTVIKDNNRKEKPLKKQYSVVEEITLDRGLEKDPWL